MRKILTKLFTSKDKELHDQAYMLWRNEYRSESFDYIFIKMKNGEYSSISGGSL